MRCPKCGSEKIERVIIPSLKRFEVSKFIEPESKPEVNEKIKCIKCGHTFKD